MSDLLNSKKNKIDNQTYEDYWSTTMAITNFFDSQFKKTLAIIINHIDTYKLADKRDDELIKNLKSTRKQFDQEIVHGKELEEKIRNVFPNDDDTGASTRKQINEFVKLGFVKPYLKGYVPAAKEFIKPKQSSENLHRLFSDTVYEYSSFNSSQTCDDSSHNQIQFVVKTLLNRKTKELTGTELIGLMTQDVSERPYADEKTISTGVNWVKIIGFKERKYNQISHLKSILKNMELFSIIPGESKWDFTLKLQEDAKEYIPVPNNTRRDSYRFAMMKKAVYIESEQRYGKKICWLTKKETEGLVVSHIYASADALRNWDVDEAYDPNNAFLLAPGNPDQYFDKYKMTFSDDGHVIFGQYVSDSFVEEVENNNYRIDKEILNTDRVEYLKVHNQKFFQKNR